jgi:predicted esterase
VNTLSRISASFLLATFMLFVAPLPAQDKAAWWSAEVEQALKRAGDNRKELVHALTNIPAEQRPGLTFLLVNMPEPDLRSLRGDFLLENTDLAYKARKQLAWGEQIPEDVFFNNVLPYANVDEKRDPWRKEMYDLCLPIVKDCKTPTEAAQKLNATVFNKLKVKYSTGRKLAQQSPKESIEQGLASCTGLSILLSDACRSVAVPTRLAGTPLWANKKGNHTWVEIWDGDWHFTGACEPDPAGLDRGWFVAEAAKAIKDSAVHAIYAVSFKKTGVNFPLVWAPDSKNVFAENVTDRYTAKQGKEPAVQPKIFDEQLGQIEKAARAYFAASPEKRAEWKFDASLDALLTSHEAAMRQAVWKAYQAAPIHEQKKTDFDKNVVRSGKHQSAYTIKTVGTRPKEGWPLFIAMHGGGGVPKAVNDSQWKHMQIYYKDQPSVTGYKYLALRAPNDEWNGFYDLYVPPLISNLIQQFLLFGDVDPAKVFLMGYSHGGYGAFYIGPKIPDHFAAVHCSASAPTDGTISAKSLRNTHFTFMIGENDTAFGRRERCEKFNQEIMRLKEQDKEHYPVAMEFKKGVGHVGLPDRDKVKDMYPETRNPVPRQLTWEMTDSQITNFFWLGVPQPGKDKSLDVSLQDNHAQITTRNLGKFHLNLDGRLIAFDRPLEITLDGKKQTIKMQPQFATLCRSMLERGDPELAYTCVVTLP